MSTTSVAVFTAVFGDYDAPHPPVAQSTPTTWRLFCDDKMQQPAHDWERVVATPPHAHPRLSAKWFRMNPHVVLPEVEVSIWIDASIRVTSADFVKDMLTHLGDELFALPLHPERTNIWSEAEASMAMPKYAGQPIGEQIAHYRSEGFESKTLYATGVLVRRHHDPLVQEVGRRWMRECVRWSYQDQLSLPYVLDAVGLVPTLLPENVYENQYWVWDRKYRLETGKQTR